MDDDSREMHVVVDIVNPPTGLEDAGHIENDERVLEEIVFNEPQHVRVVQAVGFLEFLEMVVDRGDGLVSIVRGLDPGKKGAFPCLRNICLGCVTHSKRSFLIMIKHGSITTR